jgi:hypothetical protein
VSGPDPDNIFRLLCSLMTCIRAKKKKNCKVFFFFFKGQSFKKTKASFPRHFCDLFALVPVLN